MQQHPLASPPRISTAIAAYNAGTNRRAFDFLGVHPARQGEVNGWQFILWAPNAKSVSLVGDFNGWQTEAHPMERIYDDFWFLFTDEIGEYGLYKYAVTQHDGEIVMKTDPYAFYTEPPPATAGKVYDPRGFDWEDEAWLNHRRKQDIHTAPMNCYEVHPGSWRTFADGAPFGYRKLAEDLIPYVRSMGYTHLALLPMAEHPDTNSLGYEVTGFFAPTSRYGEPRDFMYFINECHKAGLGVFMDWAGAHFPKNEHGLYAFDGTCLYEHADPDHPERTTCLFDSNKGGVRSFLLSNAIFWLEYFHLDGIRVDGVTSMLYRTHPQNNPPPSGSTGRENAASLTFLQALNQAIHTDFPDVITLAEESTAWRGITADTQSGGLGFDFKWNTDWTAQALDYLRLDPLFRKGQHENLTRPLSSAFTEQHLLPLSHHGMGPGSLSLIDRMAGSYDDKFANLRLLFAMMMAYPGKKLTFMGSEIAQFAAWSPNKGLDFFLLDYPSHANFHTFVRDLNFFYLEREALWQNDAGPDGFQWILPDDRDSSVIAFRRIGTPLQELLVVMNFTPVARENYPLGVPHAGVYTEVFSTNQAEYGGDGSQNTPMEAIPESLHDLPYRIHVNLPPLSALFLEVSRVGQGFHSYNSILYERGASN
ncbi:MAG: 1,4-alpha-glucan branching protein GlgB [Clostridia bacterium]|nr:1,4-alpha-glucan branching protein GlgB [Clostridia bacterium]